MRQQIALYTDQFINLPVQLTINESARLYTCTYVYATSWCSPEHNKLSKGTITWLALYGYIYNTRLDFPDSEEEASPMHAVEETHSYRHGNHTGSEFEREAVSVSEMTDTQELRIAEKDKELRT